MIFIHNSNIIIEYNNFSLDKLTNVIKVIASYNSVMFLKNDGSVWGVGYNGYGELGDNSTIQRNSPVQANIENVVDIKTDGVSMFYLQNNGDLYLSGSHANHKVPKLIHTNVIEITGGRSNAYVNVITSNRIYYYQHNDTNVEDNLITNRMYMRYSDVIYIQNGEVYARGDNQQGKLGIGTNQTYYDFRKSRV